MSTIQLKDESMCHDVVESSRKGPVDSVLPAAPVLKDAVMEFRLKHGLCYGCGTRLYELSEGGQLKPLTIKGVVTQGRCLFCYPDRERKRTTTSSSNEGWSQGKKRMRSQPPQFVKQEEQQSTTGDELDSLTASSVARLPSIDRLQDEFFEDDGSAIDVLSFDDLEDENSSTKPPAVVERCDNQKGQTEPIKIKIRDFERSEYVGTVLEGTAKKGRGIFRHAYKKGEFKGKEAVYEGEFENGRMQGQGTNRDPSGCVYTGGFYRGAAHGYGTCTWSNEWRYEGEWVMDQRQGKGTLRQEAEDGEVYEGDWKQDQWHGKGVLKFAGGGRYVGDFRKHKLHGRGRYEFSDKSVYEGSFKDDLRVGIGTMTYVDGLQYVGEWKNNWREGKGTLFYKDGSVFKGVFRGDEKVSGVLHLPDGIMRRETYVNGILQS